MTMTRIILVFTLIWAWNGLLAQQDSSYTLHGFVTDAESGEPISGVTIAIKQTATGTLSDSLGQFSLFVQSDQILIIQYLGYTTQEVPVLQQDSLHIQLSQEITSLDEVVVLGYGTVNKAALTGRVSGISLKGRRRKNKRSRPLTLQTAPKRNRNKPLDKKETFAYPANIPASRPTPTPIDDTEEEPNREGYRPIEERSFKAVTDEPLSTFSIDVDKASYANVRRYLTSHTLPPKDAVRIEECINYFTYNYPRPINEHPFNVLTQMTSCPWQPDHYLLHIALQGRKLDLEQAPPSNLVFLLDVSGSMNDPAKLPLLVDGFQLLVDALRPEDRVAIVVYAGAAGLVLPSTPGDQKSKIKQALDNLRAGGSTAGGAGIKLAYQIAKDHFIEGGNNRVILATDGDFNVGLSSDAAMVRLIKAKRETGVFLSVLGFGTGNYQDAKMEQIADHGNGNYAYIDNLQEAKKVLVRDLTGTLFTIAKDVKLQLEFNPLKVKGYRLIGYENRHLENEDFKNDKKDAGELGAGHQVTAFYEIIPAASTEQVNAGIAPLKYQDLSTTAAAQTAEWLTVKLRYKQPAGSKSILLSHAHSDAPIAFQDAGENLQFATAVTGLGLLLRNSPYKGDLSYNQVLNWAQTAQGEDPHGDRAEFIGLVKKARGLSRKTR